MDFNYKVWIIILIIIIVLTAIITIVNEKAKSGSTASFRAIAPVITALVMAIGISYAFQNAYEDSSDDAEEYEEAATEEEVVYEEASISKVDYEQYEANHGEAYENVTCYASSSLDEAKYGGDKVIDGNKDTCWQDGQADVGIGESLYFEFEEPIDLYTISIMNGRLISQEKYVQNARPYSFTVTDNNGDSAKIYLDDNYDETQYFVIDNGFKNVSSLTFYVDEVYYGEKYEDTCVSEIGFTRY